MESEWQEMAIGEIADVIGGGTPSTKEEANFNGDIPWITPKDLSGYPYRYISRGQRNITKRGLSESSARLLPGGAVLLTTRAPVGYVAIAKKALTTNQGFRSLILRDGYWPEFVYYLLKSSTVYLKSQASGTTFGELSGSTLKSLRFLFPPLSEQRAIACILGTLDDKIELNRRINETLEGIARAIFKSWFVDFDPVWAKAAGQQPPGLAPHIADLFPDEFEESSLGLIPAGWRVDTILAVGELLSGGTPSTKVPEYWNGDIKWVSAKDVSGAHGTFLLDTERTITQEGVDNSSTKILPELTTIVTARGTVGSYCILAEPMAMNQTNYGLKAISENCDYFVFFALGSLISQLKQRAYGTIFDTVTTRTFETSQIVVSGDAVITEFDQHVRPLMEKIRQNLRQSRTLATIRDTLLPRLISGELRVSDAERFMEARI